ncbi:MAG: hypothetical protein AAFU79_19805, partial [Myxococcota bacterium]
MPDRPDDGSFRIADVQRRTLPRPGGPPAGAPAEQAPSVGFPEVERWLEEGSMEELAEALRPRYDELERLATSGGLREKGGAKKAMAAYERAADLFEYL